MRKPNTLLEVVREYADEAVAHNAMRDRRWPDGVACPYCGSAKVGYIETGSTKPNKKSSTGFKTTMRRYWKCNECAKQFTCKTGTIFEESPLGFSRWLPCIWLIANAKNGISSCEVGRALGITQKTAWHMLHRIREAMRTGSFTQLSGEVEADETFIGGRIQNMHKSRVDALGDKHNAHGRKFGVEIKTTVLGMLERDGRIVTMVIPDRSTSTLQTFVRRHVKPGSKVFTDEYHSYRHLRFGFDHGVVVHALGYGGGDMHTNGIENYWSLLKRTIKGPTFRSKRSTFTPISMSRRTASMSARVRTPRGLRSS